MPSSNIGKYLLRKLRRKAPSYVPVEVNVLRNAPAKFAETLTPANRGTLLFPIKR